MNIDNELIKSLTEALNNIPNQTKVTRKGESSYDLASKLRKAIDALPLHDNADNDQPTTCPKCGSRTDFVELTNWKQIHSCINCKYEFVLAFD